MPSTGELNLAGTSTPISVCQEIGRGLTTSINMDETVVRTLAGVSTTSGTTWGMGSLYGRQSRVSITVNATGAVNNLNPFPYRDTGGTNITRTGTGAYIAGISDITVLVDAAVTVGSTSTATPALTIDTQWAAGDTVRIVNNGTIVGCGGKGGNGLSITWGTTGGVFTSVGDAGAVGGNALSIGRAVTIYNYGTIGGGGGGGGSGVSSASGSFKSSQGYAGCGGGGGAGVSGGAIGTNGSASGYVSNWTVPTPASAGTATAGGAGVAAVYMGNQVSGAGGSRGASGGVGGAGTGAAGGAGGKYLTGNANVTWMATGTLLGGVA